MNEMQVFGNPEFGSIRTIEGDGKVLFCASDVAKALGYARPNDAIVSHCRCTAKRRIPHPQTYFVDRFLSNREGRKCRE